MEKVWSPQDEHFERHTTHVTSETKSLSLLQLYMNRYTNTAILMQTYFFSSVSLVSTKMVICNSVFATLVKGISFVSVFRKDLKNRKIMISKKLNYLNSILKGCLEQG